MSIESTSVFYLFRLIPPRLPHAPLFAGVDNSIQRTIKKLSRTLVVQMSGLFQTFSLLCMADRSIRQVLCSGNSRRNRVQRTDRDRLEPKVHSLQLHTGCELSHRNQVRNLLLLETESIYNQRTEGSVGSDWRHSCRSSSLAS